MYILKACDMGNEEKHVYRRNCLEFLYTSLEVRHSVNRFLITTRDLRASDLGLDRWITPPIAKGLGPSRWVLSEISAPAIVVYGIRNLSTHPTITELSIFKSDALYVHLNIEKIYAGLPLIENLAHVLSKTDTSEHLEEFLGRSELDGSIYPFEGYFNEPLLFLKGDLIQIRIQADHETSPGDRLMFDAFVGEKLEENP